MSGIKDQSKLTKGKGFKLVKAAEDAIKTVAAPFTHAANFTKSALSGTFNRKTKKRGGKV